MSNQAIDLDPSKLLSAISANLNSQFYVASREHSKRLYYDLADGKPMPFIQLKTESSGDINCYLQLDSNEYTGKLSFGKFRKALAVMLLGIKNRIEADESLNILSSEQGDILFNIPGFLQNADGTNIMVCGTRQVEAGSMTVRLMFLDPVQYEAQVRNIAVKVDEQPTNN